MSYTLIEKYAKPIYCAACGAMLLGSVSISQHWAESPGCARNVGCEHRHEPHAPEAPWNSDANGGDRIVMTSSTAPSSLTSTASYSPLLR